MQIIPSHHPLHRRSFLHATGKFAAAAAVLPTTLLKQKTTGQEKHEPNYDVSINEGLMREHGILKRVLLIYDEVARRIDAKEDFPPQTVIDSAEIIRKFIEDYHQKLEEEHIFPLFRKYYRRQDVLRLYAQKLLDLVDVLCEQHEAGRRLTDRIASTPAAQSPIAKRRGRLPDNGLCQKAHSYFRVLFEVANCNLKRIFPIRISGSCRKPAWQFPSSPGFLCSANRKSFWIATWPSFTAFRSIV